jgi:periplasmic copper chaperone A
VPDYTVRCFVAFLMAVVGAFLIGVGEAHEYRRGDLQFDHPWARALPAVAKNGAVYLEIRNTGTAPDRLVAISTPAAESAELHRTQIDGGIARMGELATLEIKPGDSALLHPGGLHIMLNGLKLPLKAGTEFPLTLRFERAGLVELEIRVERAPTHAPAPAPSAHSH